MQAVKKTASIHQLRKQEVRALTTQRHIVTKYFVDGKKNLVSRENRAKNADNAVKLATGHMRANDYDALVCEVWDELLNLVLTVITRDVTGALMVMDYVDPITGKPITEQPWKRKLKRMFPNLFIRNDDGSERNLTLNEFREIYNAMQPQPEGMAP